jgi:threonine/homoserine/homoserine lactone efflux protein
VAHGYLIGILLAAQVGPVTLLIIRSVLRGGRAVAVGLAMAGAVALVDVLYATAGLAGAGQFVSSGSARVALGVVSAVLLVGIGLRTIWAGWQARSGLESAADVVLPERAFLTAVAATALNPLTIALWTISFPAAAPAADGSVQTVALLAGVTLGTLTWYAGIATVVALARAQVGPRFVAGVDLTTGCGLVGFGGLIGYRSIHER